MEPYAVAAVRTAIASPPAGHQRSVVTGQDDRGLRRKDEVQVLDLARVVGEGVRP